MTIPTKVAIGALTLGSVGIAGYAASPYFKTESKQQEQEVKSKISDLLNSKYEYISLSTKVGEGNEDKTLWGTIWDDYKTKSNNFFGLANWDKKDTEALTEQLKVKCGSLLNSNIESDKDPNYQNYVKYCTREATVEDEAKRNKLVAIEADKDTVDATTWKEKIDKKDEIQKHLTKLGVEDSELNAPKLREKCKEAKVKKKPRAADYQAIYEAYVSVCTTKPAGV